MKNLYICYQDKNDVENLNIYLDKDNVLELSIFYPSYVFEIFVNVNGKYKMSYNYIQNGILYKDEKKVKRVDLSKISTLFN